MTRRRLTRRALIGEVDFEFTEPERPCSMCAGEGAVGTGLSTSFVDQSDAMPCPRCDGTGEEPK